MTGRVDGRAAHLGPRPMATLTSNAKEPAGALSMCFLQQGNAHLSNTGINAI